MPSLALAGAAGAGNGLEQVLNRIAEDAKMEQLKKIQNGQLDESVRSHTANEAIDRERIAATERERVSRDAATQAERDRAEGRAARDDSRQAMDTIPSGTVIPETDPTVKMADTAGFGSLLRGVKSRPAVPVGPLQEEDQGQAIPVDSRIKLKSFNQQKEAASEVDRSTQRAETMRHDLEMEGRQPRQPDPQPTIMFDKEGKAHAVQFSGGSSREIPLPNADFSKQSPIDPKQANMKKGGLDAVTRVEADIDAANAMGLIGPAAGRIYEQFAKLGTTGDPAKDHLIGRLKSDLLLTKMHVDAGIGGTRAAASPLLLKNWEQLALNSSPDLLKGYTSAIRDDMTVGSGGGVTVTPDAGGNNGTKVIKYDLKGNIVP